VVKRVEPSLSRTEKGGGGRKKGVFIQWGKSWCTAREEMFISIKIEEKGKAGRLRSRGMLSANYNQGQQTSSELYQGEGSKEWWSNGSNTHTSTA